MGLSHLTNPLATPVQLQSSSSQIDGVPADLEDSIRYEGVRLLQAAGVLLRLPQELIAEAIVTFTRFWVGFEGGSLVEYGAKVCTLDTGLIPCTGLTILGCRVRLVILGDKAICTPCQSSSATFGNGIFGQSQAKPGCRLFG